MDFEIWNFQRKLDVVMMYTKVVILNTIYKSVVDFFYIWSCLESQIYVLS
jgi:hypothetical protein